MKGGSGPPDALSLGSEAQMFEGFTLASIDTGEASLRVRYGGDVHT